MRGFGAPDTTDQAFPADPTLPPGEPDWGFGDAEPAAPFAFDATYPDYGWGSPAGPLDAQVFIINYGGIGGRAPAYPDEGGVIVRLLGDWPFAGPYRAYLFEHFTSAPVPDVGARTAPLTYDLQGRANPRPDPTELYPTMRQPAPGEPSGLILGRTLEFLLPPLPCGLYDIEIRWAGANVRTLPGAVRVVFRSRHRGDWRVRRRLPEFFAAGARASRGERLLAVE